jgi:hypothetical protein
MSLKEHSVGIFSANRPLDVKTLLAGVGLPKIMKNKIVYTLNYTMSQYVYGLWKVSFSF